MPYEGEEVLAAEEDEREELLEEPVTPALLDAEGEEFLVCGAELLVCGEELLVCGEELMVCGAELLTAEREGDDDETEFRPDPPEELLACEYPQTGATSIMDAATAETAIV